MELRDSENLVLDAPVDVGHRRSELAGAAAAASLRPGGRLRHRELRGQLTVAAVYSEGRGSTSVGWLARRALRLARSLTTGSSPIDLTSFFTGTPASRARIVAPVS